MKRALRILSGIIALFILVSVIACGFTIFDYQWECTRCLRGYHVVEKRFYGITYSRKEKLIFIGHDLTKIDETPCQHIYRKGGFGEESYGLISVLISDGMTSEGNFFRPRWEALKAAFDLFERFPNKELMHETQDFIDFYLPANASVHDPKIPNSGIVMLLAFSLERAQSEADWKKALEDIKSLVVEDPKKAK